MSLIDSIKGVLGGPVKTEQTTVTKPADTGSSVNWGYVIGGVVIFIVVVVVVWAIWFRKKPAPKTA